jgi:hypothetical protein
MSTPIDELWNNTWKYDNFDRNVMDLVEQIEFFIGILAETTSLRKVMDLLEHLKPLQSWKTSTQILFTIKEQIIILQHSKMSNTNVSRVKLFMEEQTSNALKNNEKLVV